MEALVEDWEFGKKWQERLQDVLGPEIWACELRRMTDSLGMSRKGKSEEGHCGCQARHRAHPNTQAGRKTGRLDTEEGKT